MWTLSSGGADERRPAERARDGCEARTVVRRGQNPAKFVGHVAAPERITVAVLTYIPFLSGFHRDALQVLQACLESLWAATDLPYDLLVFDNGSGPETVEYLRQAQAQGKIQYLILCEKNLGKGGAWNIIFPAAPGEILAYTDSDAFFYHGWLSDSVRILETYPKVGMVTSRPFRTPPELYASTVAWAEGEPAAALERGCFIPWETFREFDLSLGQSEEEVRRRYQTTQDLRLTYKELPAYIGASHWQFVGLTSVLRQFLPFRMDRPMGQVRALDRLVDQAGYLRLMTAEPRVMNMSNAVDGVPWGDRRPGLARQAGRDGARSGGGSRIKPGRSLRRRLLAIPPLKRVLLGVYNRIFRWYYGD